MRMLRRVRRFLRAEFKAVSSLIPLIFISLLIVFALAGSGVTLAHPAFQSPLSTPTTEAPPAGTEAPTELPGAPTPEAPVEPTPEVPVEPTPEFPVEQTPEVPGEMPPEAPAEPQDTPPEAEPPQEPAAAPGGEEGASNPPDSPGATLIDTCLVGFSYLWLCLGGLVLILFVLGVALSFMLRSP